MQSTPTYRLALKKVNEASRKYREVQAAYRARQIDDATYLAARKVYEDANAAFEAVAQLKETSNEQTKVYLIERKNIRQFWYGDWDWSYDTEFVDE